MEKLLGRWYKWYFLVGYWIKANTIYFWSEFFVGLNRTLVLLGTCVIFLYLGGENQQPILNYLLLGNIFFTITDPIISWFVSSNIRDGNLTRWLTYPIKYINFLFFTGFSNCVYLSITALISLIPVVILFRQYLDLAGNFSIFVPFLFISFGIKFSIQIMTGFSSFWFTDGSGANHLVQNSENFLSGSMFPLYILPAYFGWIQYLPFAFTFYHPMQIYLGKYDTNQTILVFFGGIVWCVVLYFLAKLVFKFGLKRNESVGL